MNQAVILRAPPWPAHRSTPPKRLRIIIHTSEQDEMPAPDLIDQIIEAVFEQLDTWRVELRLREPPAQPRA